MAEKFRNQVRFQNGQVNNLNGHGFKTLSTANANFIGLDISSNG